MSTRSARRGYTILELVVVVVIVSILAGVVAAAGAQVADVMYDRDARSRADRLVLAQRGWASRNLAWTDDSANLVVGRGLTLTGGVSTGPNVVSFRAEDGIRLGVAVLSRTGSCQGKFLGDPLTERDETWVTLPTDWPCSGQSVVSLNR